MVTTKLRWLPRLLLILSAFFLIEQTTALASTESDQRYVDSSSGVHPVVLLPGYSCSQIEVRLTDAYEPPSPLCAARKGDGRWSRLWKNITAPDAEVPCFADQLRLVYDDDAGDYVNAPGVETRALSFGSTRGFLADDPADKELCMGKLVEALEEAGYRDGETLFGAPYDFRHAPAAAGLANRELSLFRQRLRALVERASGANEGKPVILVSHSAGGYFTLDFLRRSPLPWRKRFIKHFIMASTGAGGRRPVAAEREQDLRRHVHCAAVSHSFRRRHAASGHGEQELRRERHAGVPGGGRAAAVRGAALRDAGASCGAKPRSSRVSRDVRQWRRRADTGDAGVPERPRRRPGGGIRRRRRGCELGKHTGA
ncbi:unnamed protein product [Alopecurus aequalis]